MSTFLEKDSFSLPDELSQIYEVTSCLKFTEQTATYLLREKQSEHVYLLKTASDPVFAEFLTNEKDILEYIHKQKISSLTSSFPTPVYLKTYPESDTTYYIRTYIAGKTLEELCETEYQKPGLPPSRALDYIIALTELLQFLHRLDPPLIHRDIKPQNVVIDAEGGCHFIDLGISRFYQAEKRSDTFIMGTKLTAPPEQFGYQQTDMRSDLYSMGILLLYCVTGEYKAEGQNLSELPETMQYIIRKATMFDPDKRYQSADELLPDLLHARYPDAPYSMHAAVQKRTRSYRMAIGILLAFDLILLALLLFTKISPLDISALTGQSGASDIQASSAGEYTFKEPLIEEAIRKQLNIPEGPVTESDLLKVTELHIFGLQIYSDDSEVWLRGEFPWFYDDETRESGLYLQKGPVSSLEDIAHLPNLRVLSLYGQQITDISILKDTQIQQLGLGYNPLTDLEPLRDNTAIQYLNLATLDITDISVLSTLPNLTSLNISSTGVESLEGLENCRIQTLNLYQAKLKDHEQIRRLSSLKSLSLYTIDSEIFEQLNGLPLTEIEIAYSNGLSLNEFSVFPQLKILKFSGNHDARLTLDRPDLPYLEELDLRAVTVSDFSGLSSLTSLRSLAIYSTVCESYDGLDQLPQLKELVCTEEQKEMIEKQYPDKSYIYAY